MKSAKSLKNLQKIPGVGPSIAEDLWDLGFKTVESLKNADPEVLYERQCKLQADIEQF